jgi:N-ethylmaleimide reductase
MEGWKLVLEAVHAKGGVLFLQIFHAGRCTHPLKNNNQEVWAPSAIAVREIIRDIGGK